MASWFEVDNGRYGCRYRFIIFLIVLGFASFKEYGDDPKFQVCLFLMIMVPLVRWLLKIHSYKSSITLVDKRYVLSKNTLKNDYCTVIYTENEKIVVMDNCATKQHPQRMFTLTKGKSSINRNWNDICKAFDNCTAFDYLMTFYGADANCETVILSTKPAEYNKSKFNISKHSVGPTYVEMNDVTPDSFAEGTNVQNTAGAAFVSMNSIPEKQPEQQRAQEQEQFTDMADIQVDRSVSKIDVNNASADELSALPGINIILAKKIVEYRNLNGMFKSVEDFIQAAKVKPHFVDKIRSMVIIGVKSDKDDDDHFEGRIVDF